jgi:hypothetical protein
MTRSQGTGAHGVLAPPAELGFPVAQDQVRVQARCGQVFAKPTGRKFSRAEKRARGAQPRFTSLLTRDRSVRSGSFPF